MADSSPGKVQALRAMFAQKNEPVMGVIPSSKIGPRPWKKSTTSLNLENLPESTENERNHLPVSACASKAMLKALQTTDTFKGDTSCDKIIKTGSKPAIGPKPVFLSQENRTTSTAALNMSYSGHTVNKVLEQPFKRTQSENNSSVIDEKSKILADTIASFMHLNGNSHSVLNGDNRVPKNFLVNCEKLQKPIVKPKTLVNGTNSLPTTVAVNNNKSKEIISNNVKKADSCASLINSDNYICKNRTFRRQELPPAEKLGPPPLKPVRPPHIKLPKIWCQNEEECVTSSNTNSRVIREYIHRLCALPLQAASYPPRPAYPCPVKPVTSSSSPVPPSVEPSSCTTKSSVTSETRNVKTKSLLEEIEELYDDALLPEKKGRPVLLISNYVAERAESSLDELYDDAGSESLRFNNFPYPTKPKNPPPPPPPFEYLSSQLNNSVEELYQDAIEPDEDEFYEIMPNEMSLDESGSPLYSNTKKELERIKREEEKRTRKELRLKEKREKEMEKVRKKFGITGEEIPIDAGLVKADCRGGRNDLSVKKGETVLILRIEGNPSGKWLVKNERGKYGYVELTNIEVDPDSVKSVMSIRRTSVISESEELYSEAYSEVEGIYEMTY